LRQSAVSRRAKHRSAVLEEATQRDIFSLRFHRQTAINNQPLFHPTEFRPIPRAELIWDGKYDDKGQRVKPLRVKLPFQTVETVNESVEDRQSLFRTSPNDIPWRNRLIWGDKKFVLPALLEEFAGKVNLIYIDPPFDTGADFSFTATVPSADEDNDPASITFEKQPSIIEQKAYRDTWERDSIPICTGSTKR
jgi:hypothetical protein